MIAWLRSERDPLIGRMVD